ncbi:MAG: AAA family ATPase, partial [Bacteroidaceae bacterium]|nr:AAA family ATPase [Bacteroidaceae bacterium]
RGLKERYENHHKVRILDDAVIAAVQLSQRYITERFLPDKAIDLMDEAAAKLRMERDSVPEELDEISRRLKQLEIEREAIRRESNSPLSNSQKGDGSKLDIIEKEISDLRGQETEMRKQWESEKQQADQIQTLKDRMQQLRQEAEQAERDGNYAKVAEIRYSKLPEIEKESLSLSTSTEGKENRMLRDEVTADDIADVVSRWTGIPVTKMQTSETEKLLHLEEELHKRVVGQEEAIAAVCNAVRRSRAGLQDPKRPIGSFIFLGSTGVGKTELAKALAEYLFDDETMMTRIDMSEYQEKFSVTRLIGAPPGYVGYDEGGQLTEAVRRKPYQVVLFDEIEKAHPDVFNTLLQVLDDGRLTDSKGRTVNFKNTIIIMTSNLLTGADLDKGEDDVRNLLVQRGIRPEFLNRIDETIVFHPLNWGEVKQIVRLQVESIQRMLRENGLTLEISDAAIDLLANEGYDPDFGARPVKRAVQRLLLDGLSKELLAGRLDRNRPIRVDAAEDRITME